MKRITSRYKKLAKKYHPDRAAREGLAPDVAKVRRAAHAVSCVAAVLDHSPPPPPPPPPQSKFQEIANAYQALKYWKSHGREEVDDEEGDAGDGGFDWVDPMELFMMMCVAFASPLLWKERARPSPLPRRR